MDKYFSFIGRLIGTIVFGFIAMGAAATLVSGGPSGVTGENALPMTISALLALGAVIWFFWFRKRNRQ